MRYIFISCIFSNVACVLSQSRHHRHSAKLSLIVGIGTPLIPHPQPRMQPPPPRFRGEGHTRWRERGWESPNSDERTYTVNICTLLCFFLFFLSSGVCETDQRPKHAASYKVKVHSYSFFGSYQ
jgi:hypothetical protein